MKKLKQEMKDSKRYEYGEFVKGGDPSYIGYQGFRDHNSDCEVIVVKKEINKETKETGEHLQICFPFEKNCPEFKAVAEVYEEISLEELEKITEIFKSIEERK